MGRIILRRLVLAPASPFDDGSYLLFCHGATKFSEKGGHAYHGVGLRVLLWNGEKLGTSRQYWLADSRFLVLVIFVDLFLCQRRWNYPNVLSVYTRHFVIVFLGGFFW